MIGEKQRVLIIDDEKNLRHYLELLLSREGFDVESAENAEVALKYLAEGKEYQIILCDIRMPKMDGLQFLREFKRRGYPGEVIMMSAYGSKDTAIEAVKLGAYDYIDKPLQKDELLLTLQKLIERERLRRDNQRLQDALIEACSEDGIIGQSESLKKVLNVARKVAPFPSTVLILGENGTGKELIARAIHRWSPRAQKPFIAVNCGSVPENLLESEFFGYQKGAFTGAYRDPSGLFEAADGGTLFLDEISELPLSLQVKLLRVLQEGKIRRLGETRDRPVNVRIIAASNRDLESEIQKGNFREDLYYRLNVVSLYLPPLRKRREDIPLLLEHFIKKINARFGTKLKGVSPEAMRILMNYQWKGNIRELKNVVEQAAVLSEGEYITPESLPDYIRNRNRQNPDSNFSWLDGELSIKKAQRKLEEFLIRKALEKTGGNKSAAARLLEISHRALLYKIKEYNIEVE